MNLNKIDKCEWKRWVNEGDMYWRRRYIWMKKWLLEKEMNVNEKSDFKDLSVNEKIYECE